MVSQRPRRQYMVLQWGQVDLQEYANGSLVSNNNIFTIPFLNTYYHKQMKRILIAAYNETFKQSSDPVYAHTPMRNTGELRTFNPKLKDSAGGEVNEAKLVLFQSNSGGQNGSYTTYGLYHQSKSEQSNLTYFELLKHVFKFKLLKHTINPFLQPYTIVIKQ